MSEGWNYDTIPKGEIKMSDIFHDAEKDDIRSTIRTVRERVTNNVQKRLIKSILQNVSVEEIKQFKEKNSVPKQNSKDYFLVLESFNLTDNLLNLLENNLNEEEFREIKKKSDSERNIYLKLLSEEAEKQLSTLESYVLYGDTILCQIPNRHYKSQAEKEIDRRIDFIYRGMNVEKQIDKLSEFYKDNLLDLYVTDIFNSDTKTIEFYKNYLTGNIKPEEVAKRINISDEEINALETLPENIDIDNVKILAKKLEWKDEEEIMVESDEEKIEVE